MYVLLESSTILFLYFHLFNVWLNWHFVCVEKQCEHIPGLGFRRGSYRCECKDGFYFPDKNAPVHYYNGTVIEEEYEKKLMVCSINPILLISHFSYLFSLFALHLFSPFNNSTPNTLTWTSKPVSYLDSRTFQELVAYLYAQCWTGNKRQKVCSC